MRVVYPNQSEGVAGKSRFLVSCGGCGEIIPRGSYFTMHYGRENKNEYTKQRLPFCSTCYPFRFPYPGGITLYRDASRTPIEDEK